MKLFTVPGHSHVDCELLHTCFPDYSRLTALRLWSVAHCPGRNLLLRDHHANNWLVISKAMITQILTTLFRLRRYAPRILVLPCCTIHSHLSRHRYYRRWSGGGRRYQIRALDWTTSALRLVYTHTYTKQHLDQARKGAGNWATTTADRSTHRTDAYNANEYASRRWVLYWATHTASATWSRSVVGSAETICSLRLSAIVYGRLLCICSCRHKYSS